MTPVRTLATAGRVLQQLRRDRRSVALMLVVPVVLIALLKWVYWDNEAVFDRIGLPLLGIFPFVTMFLVTSVATLRERQSGTLERLLAMPMGKGDLLLGYQAYSFDYETRGKNGRDVRLLETLAGPVVGLAWKF